MPSKGTFVFHQCHYHQKYQVKSRKKISTDCNVLQRAIDQHYAPESSRVENVLMLGVSGVRTYVVLVVDIVLNTNKSISHLKPRK